MDSLMKTPEAPSCEELVARAQALLPGFRARALETERARRLPDESVAELRAAQFHRILQPVRFGGFGLGPDTAAEVVRTVATSCGSTGWVTNLFILHNSQIGLFPMEAQQEYWATSQDVLASTASTSMSSKLDAAPGGFRLSGRWKFSSGADFADWFVIMKPSSTCLDWLLVPRRDVTIVDDWFVAGLSGTGSKDIVLEDAFIPAHRVLKIADAMAGTTPGGLAHGSGLARLPFPVPAVWGIPPAIIGMVSGMADAVKASLVGKRALFTGEPQIERVANQIKLAEAHADIQAAELIMRNRLAIIQQWARDGVVPQGADALSAQRDAAYVARRMATTAMNLAIMAGASSVYLTNPIQRFLRDVMVAATHVSLVWEEAGESYGRAVWELPPKMPG